MDQYSLKQSIQYAAQATVTPTDVEQIEQVRTWVLSAEVLFTVFLLLGMVVTLMIVSKETSTKPIWNFIVLNLCIGIAIGCLGYAIAAFSSHPIGNVLQILVLPAYCLIGFIIYTLYKTRKMKKREIHVF